MSRLTEDDLVAALRKHYEIAATSAELVPGGEDANAWVYRVEAEQPPARYLVKVRAATGANELAVAIPRYLHESGLAHVVSPILSKSHSLLVEEAGSSLTIYPFIEGRTGTEAGLSESHWRTLGGLVKHLHRDSLPPHLIDLLATETYRRSEVDIVRQLDNVVLDRRFSDPLGNEVAAFWTAQRDQIQTLVERTEELGWQLEGLALPLVTCHADLHTWNVMIDADDELWVVDWDEVTRAPKERDLMFVVGGIHADLIKPHETACFFEGYGDVIVDPLALSFYRCAWAVQDIAGFGERVFLPVEPEEESRNSAARLLRGLFDEGGIVELALASADPAT